HREARWYRGAGGQAAHSARGRATRSRDLSSLPGVNGLEPVSYEPATGVSTWEWDGEASLPFPDEFKPAAWETGPKGQHWVRLTAGHVQQLGLSSRLRDAVAGREGFSEATGGPSEPVRVHARP